MTFKWQLKIKLNPALQGDKIQLPQEVLDELVSSQALQSPLTFLLETETSKKAYVSVQQFTSLPTELQMGANTHALLGNAAIDTQIAVTLVKLEKADYIKLSPQSQRYLEIDDPKSTLEWFLRSNYTTLTLNDVLHIPHTNHSGTNTHGFLVAELKKQDESLEGCCISDADVEVDIVPDSIEFGRAAVMNARKELSPIELTTKSLVRQRGSQTFKVAGVDKKYGILLNPTHACEMFASSTSSTPSVTEFEWFSAEIGSHTLFVEGDVHIVVSTVAECEYTIEIIGKEEIGKEKIGKEEIGKEDSRQCSNCRSHVAVEKYDLHTAFCERNNVYCSICCTAISKNADHWHCTDCADNRTARQKAHKQHHYEKYHSPINCKCGSLFTLENLKRHLPDCEARLITCRFCHLLLPAGKKSTTAKDLILGAGFTVHESECGALTIDCVKCGKPVQLKDVQIHANHHALMENTRPAFRCCSNVNCSAKADTNPMRLCSSCYAFFWSPTHDPGNVKVMQKLVQKIHSQLVSGCELQECRNEYCARNPHSLITRGNAVDPTDAAVLAMDALQTSCFGGALVQRYHLCVKLENGRRRAMMRELEDLGFEDVFCLKALESSNWDVGVAAAWLVENVQKKERV